MTDNDDVLNERELRDHMMEIYGCDCCSTCQSMKILDSHEALRARAERAEDANTDYQETVDTLKTELANVLERALERAEAERDERNMWRKKYDETVDKHAALIEAVREVKKGGRIIPRSGSDYRFETTETASVRKMFAALDALDSGQEGEE